MTTWPATDHTGPAALAADQDGASAAIVFGTCLTFGGRVSTSGTVPHQAAALQIRAGA